MKLVRLLRHDRSGAAGFTIIEVVFAMAILLVGMTVVLGLLTFGAALGRTAALRTAATAAIDSVVADLEETMFPLLPDGNVGEPEAIEARSVPGARDLVYSATPFENPDHHLEYRVDIEMTWKSAGVRRSKKFSTILLRQISFGERLRREFVQRASSERRSGISGLKQLKQKNEALDAPGPGN